MATIEPKDITIETLEEWSKPLKLTITHNPTNLHVTAQGEERDELQAILMDDLSDLIDRKA